MKTKKLKLYSYSLIGMLLLTAVFCLIYQALLKTPYEDLFFRISQVGILAVFAVIQFIEDDSKRIFVIKSVIAILWISLLFSIIRSDSSLTFWCHWIVTFVNSILMIPMIDIIKRKIIK